MSVQDGLMVSSHTMTPGLQSDLDSGHVARDSGAELAPPAGPSAPTRSPLRRSTGRSSKGRSGLRTWSNRYVGRLIGCDALLAAIAVVAVAAVPNLISFSPGKMYVLVLVMAIGWPITVALSRGYDRTRIGVGGDEMRAVLRSVILAIALGAVPSAITERPGLLALCVTAPPVAGLFSLLIRLGSRRHLHFRQRRGHNVRRVIVVGSAYAAADLQSVLSQDGNFGMSVIGACVPVSDLDSAMDAGLTVLGDLDQVRELVESHQADAIAVAGGHATRHNYLRELSWTLEGSDVELLVHPGLMEVAGPRMHIRPYVGLPLLHVEQPHFTGWRRLLKRATDVVLTGLGVVVISPVLALIALAIKLEDGGPVIFRQTRVGLDGSTFVMLKFRSMHLDAESRLAELRAQNPHIGVMFKMQRDPRITRVGRLLRAFSLDELPQLFNVLTGSMSLVGPRPPLQSEVDDYENHARRRLLVTPGLTGLWQVSGRSLLSWEETVRLDLRYVENWTLTFDLLIIWKTLFAVAARRGAF